MTPAVVILPIRPPGVPEVVNQRLPSAPGARQRRSRLRPPLLEWTVYSEMSPSGVIRPILLAPPSVNQRLPSDPGTMHWGFETAVGIGNSSIVWAERDAARPVAAARSRAVIARRLLTFVPRRTGGRPRPAPRGRGRAPCRRAGPRD